MRPKKATKVHECAIYPRKSITKAMAGATKTKTPHGGTGENMKFRPRDFKPKANIKGLNV